MRRDSAHAAGTVIGARAELVALALAALVALLAGCDSSTVHGSGSPARNVAAEQTATTSPAAKTPDKPAHKSPAHKRPAPKSPAHKRNKRPPAKPSTRKPPVHNAPTHSVPTQNPPTHAAPPAPPTHAAPPAPPAPHAADGRNLAACKEASCQVELVAGDHVALDPALGLDAITVKSVGSEISMALSGHGQGLNLVGRDVSSGTDCVNGACTTTGSISLTPGMTGQINQIHITLTEVVGTRAVVTMRPS